jgi:hypothetical protein
MNALRHQIWLAPALIGLFLLAASIASAGTATLVNDVVRYKANPGEANRVWIVFVPGEGIHVIDRTNVVSAGPGCISINTDAAFCERRVVRLRLVRIGVRTYDLDDRIEVDAEARIIRLRSGRGPDKLRGGKGRNLLVGGEGPDVFQPTSEGWDVADYSMRTGAVKVTIGDGLANDGGAGEGDLVSSGFEEVLGGAGDDSLVGERDRDRLWGRGGGDVIGGRGGRDRLFGGSGRDILRARDGDPDVVAGGTGYDRARLDVGLDVANSIEGFF